MKELTVISGKGGTGKTSLTACFAALAKNAVFADCDVDAADLHLLLKPQVQHTIDFYGLDVACIDDETCTKCKNCVERCRFDAISEAVEIKIDSCEGCGVCAYVCPVDAITMEKRLSGYAYISNTRFGPMAHAMLKTAEEASGKLVTQVRTLAKKLAQEKNKEIIIIDGPPGIGCPVIAAITGVDLVLIVTEPTLSAIHDLERILAVAQYFDIPATVCINKADVNKNNTKKIKTYCEKEKIPVVGELPYDTDITQAMVHEQSIVEYADGVLSQNIKQMWNTLQDELRKHG